MVGVLPSGLLYCREGTFPMFVLTTRTPIEAGPMPITPMIYTSSAAIFQTYLPRAIRSFSGTPYARLNFSMSSFMRAGGSFPWVPAD